MSAPSTKIVVRDARESDLATIVDFNCGLAEETEGKTLDRAVLSRGVSAALRDPERLRYWIAELADSGTIVGQAAVTREWSDWRNGWIWWFQSVYVLAEARNQGVFRALHTTIRNAALEAGDVVGLRLYVEHENERAQKTYNALGMKPGGYHVFEEIWPERFGGLGGSS